MARPVYLDYHATTPVDPNVLDAMLPYFTERFGNAASKQHAFGWEAQEAVERARRQVAALINAVGQRDRLHQRRHRIQQSRDQGRRVRAERSRPTTSSRLPPSTSRVLDSCARLERDGWHGHAACRSTATGFIDLDGAAIRDDRPDHAGVGDGREQRDRVLQPLAEIAAIVHERGALLHTDAAQAFGKVPLDVATLGVDLLSLTAHKCYGPKGAGALYVRRQRPKVPIECQIDGGGHENGLRSGTLNVPGIVGLGACAGSREAGAAGGIQPARQRFAIGCSTGCAAGSTASA